MKNIVIFAGVVVVFILWCFTNTNTPDALRVLRSSGYKNIHLNGYVFMACGQGDWSSTGFTALGPTGLPAEGVVCCGLIFKGCTIRQ